MKNSSMSNFKPKFWKPGDEYTGWKEERFTANNTDEVLTVVHNANASLAIENQRQRLPIFQHRNHILFLLEKYQTVVVVGETGCGKSTQIPQYLLEAGWADGNSLIGVTEPRRVAAITLASRVAEEKGTILGRGVGYSIRFDDCCNPQETKLKFMTEGILIREMMADPLLTSYSVLVVDEAHERSLNTDVLLGLLKKIAKKRRDLRLVVSSATLEANKFRDFFNANETNDRTKDTAAIISVEGRCFPVDVFYVENPVANYMKSSVETVIKLHESEARGDVLVFLTGQEEVESAVSLLVEYARENRKKDRNVGKLFVLPLYRALPPEEQLKVFRPPHQSVRKVVVATNIAEASVTLDGIRYVVDSGFVKLRYFNPHTGTDSLVVVPVSQASAEQRSGRAGRVRAGVTYRLYTEEDFHKLPIHTPPEMQRSALAPVILQLKALGIDNVLRFNFPSAPPSKNVISALELLYALGALDDNGNLTDPMGKRMAEFPLEPMFAKMLLVAGEFGCSEEILSIASMLQVQNVFLSPPGNANAARHARHLFAAEGSDHLTLLNVYTAFVKHGRNRRWCNKYFLNYKGLQRAHDIRTSLVRLLEQYDIPLVSSEGDADTVSRCVVAGFFANAAYLHYLGEYRTVRGDHTLHVHPSSVVYTQKQPQWVVFNEVLHTSREYMRDIMAVPASWLYELAPHYYCYGTNREVMMQKT